MEYKGNRFELNTKQDYEYLRDLVLCDVLKKDYISNQDRNIYTDYQSARDLLDVQYRKHLDAETCVKEWQFYFEMIDYQI